MRIEYFACHCGYANVWRDGKVDAREAETVRPVIPCEFVSSGFPRSRYEMRTGSVVDLDLSYECVSEGAMKAYGSRRTSRYESLTKVILSFVITFVRRKAA